MRKQYLATCDWEVGELIAYQLLSGRWIVLRVTGHHTDMGGTFPCVEILRGIHDSLPEAASIDRPEIVEGWIRFENPAIPPSSVVRLILLSLKASEIPLSRLVRLGFCSAHVRPDTGGNALRFRELDGGLKQIFDLL